MGLAGVMTVGMCVPVLADDGNQDINETSSISKTDIEMSVKSQYTVKIPSRIEVDSQGSEKPITLSASKTILGEGKVLEITLDTKDLSLTLDGSSAKYNMEFSGKEAVTSGEWALYTFENEIATDTSANGVTLKPADGAKITKSGTYKADVTFNIHEVVSTPTA